jgi:hypothetical protein
MTPEEQRFSAGLLPVAQRSAAGSGRPAYVGLYEDPALVGLSPRRQERPSCSACVATSPGAGSSGSPRRTTRRSRRSTVFSGSVRSSIHCSCSAAAAATRTGTTSIRSSARTCARSLRPHARRRLSRTNRRRRRHEQADRRGRGVGRPRASGWASSSRPRPRGCACSPSGQRMSCTHARARRWR